MAESTAVGAISTFFDGVCRQAAAAADGAGGWTQRRLMLAGHHLALRFAGPALLARLLPALAHLPAAPDGTADLTIDIWESAADGVAMLPPPWAHADYGTRREINDWADGSVIASYDLGAGVLSLLDLATNHAVFWVHAAERLPLYEQAAPLRTILQLWLLRRGVHFVHAAAVGLPQMGAALLVGAGGSGKSTTALACLADGLLFGGEDYCLIADGAPPTVFCAYSSAKLAADSVRQLPHLAPLALNPQRAADEKAVLLLAGAYADQIAPQMAVRAIVLPTLGAADQPHWQRTTAAAALRAVAPSTILQLTHAGRAELRALAALVRAVPCFALTLGRDARQNPAAVRQILREVTA